MVRRIMSKTDKYPQVFSKTLIFLIQPVVVALIIFFATINFHKQKNISDFMIGVKFLDFLAFSYPPTFPILFTLAFNLGLVRLKSNGIYCNNPDKTVQPSDMKTIFFDKTGTLTEDKMKLKRVLKYNKINKFQEIS